MSKHHVPRLWPVRFVDVDTREVSYELGQWNPTLRRVVTRTVKQGVRDGE